MSQEPYGVVVFADDVRFEHQNKFSLIGCYGPQLIIYSALPATLPKLAAFVQIRFPPIQIPALKFMFYFPGDTEPTQSIDFAAPQEQSISSIEDLPLSDPDLERQAGASIPFLFGPVTIQSEGYLRVRVGYEDKIIKVGALQIISQPPSVT